MQQSRHNSVRSADTNHAAHQAIIKKLSRHESLG